MIMCSFLRSTVYNLQFCVWFIILSWAWLFFFLYFPYLTQVIRAAPAAPLTCAQVCSSPFRQPRIARKSKCWTWLCAVKKWENSNIHFIFFSISLLLFLFFFFAMHLSIEKGLTYIRGVQYTTSFLRFCSVIPYSMAFYA